MAIATSTPTSSDDACCSGTEKVDCCCPGCRCGCCGNGGCCELPHGKISLLPTIMLTLAFTASMITLMIPNFAFANYADYYGDINYYEGYYGVGIYGGSAFYPPKPVQIPFDCPDEPASPPYDDMVDDMQMPFGPCFPEYRLEWEGYDYDYDDHVDDPYRKAAMSFAFIAAIVGLGAMIGMWPITCCRYGRCGRYTLLCLVVVSFISQLFTFLIFGTKYCKQEVQNGCTIGPGGATSLSAAFGWLLGAIGIALVSDAAPKGTSEGEDGDLEVVEAAVEAVPIEPIENEEKI